jgi:hypothetical protein
MTRLLVLAALLVALPAYAVVIDWVEVGDPGNACEVQPPTGPVSGDVAAATRSSLLPTSTGPGFRVAMILKPTATPTVLPAPTGGPKLTAFPTATPTFLPTATPTPGRPAICADGVDNDGDGFTDYPTDPGCANISDLTETDPSLICDDGLDNDGDALIDFPNDPDCDDSLDPSEGSPTTTPAPCLDNSSCAPYEFCEKKPGACGGTGLCVLPPANCLDIYNPVCGCDGQTYGNGCVAAQAGVSVDHFGECQEPTPTPTPTPTPAPPAPLNEDQQACVTEMNKNGAKVNKAQLKENEKCLKDYQKGKLLTSFDACTTADRKDKIDRAQDKTVAGEAKNCATLLLPPPYAYTDATTVNENAVEGALALTHTIFGGPPVQDADLATKAGDKERARCQLGMLKQASKLEETILKELNKAKGDALERGTVDSASALESVLIVALTRVPITKVQEKLKKAEERLKKRVGKKCASLQDPGAAFPGACADPDLSVVEDCVIAAARCQACLKIEAFDGLSLPCGRLYGGVPIWGCP